MRDADFSLPLALDILFLMVDYVDVYIDVFTECLNVLNLSINCKKQLCEAIISRHFKHIYR